MSRKRSLCGLRFPPEKNSDLKGLFATCRRLLQRVEEEERLCPLGQAGRRGGSRQLRHLPETHVNHKEELVAPNPAQGGPEKNVGPWRHPQNGQSVAPFCSHSVVTVCVDNARWKDQPSTQQGPRVWHWGGGAEGSDRPR